MDELTISNEQQNVINLLKDNFNVKVNSVAGSGKTTCSLFIALQNPESQILLLTYNNQLKNETQEKIKKYGITNIEAHNFHSFCCKLYIKDCYNDIILNKIITDKILPKIEFNYDIIIIDETQDLTPILFKTIIKIYKDNKQNAKLCMFGDEKQCIYQFNNADHRYLKFSPQIFKLNNLKWKETNLSTSFRVSYENAKFINENLLNENKIITTKRNIKPRYYFFSDKNFNKRILHTIGIFLKSGYNYDDIFILSGSVNNYIMKNIENAIKINPNIPIYYPSNDEINISNDIIKGKIVFSSFHQSKGRERKIVIIIGFDQGYFNYIAKDEDDTICPNTLYVATTRASEKLYVIHNNKNDYLKFLNQSSLENNCKITYNDKLMIKDNSTKKNKPYGVTNFLKFIPEEYLFEALSFLKIEKINIPSGFINITSKLYTGNNICENVADINGSVIPNYIEYILTKKLDIINKLIRNKYITENNRNKIKKIKIKNKLTLQDLIFISICDLSVKDGLNYRFSQIKKYNWIKNSELNLCFDRTMKSLNLSSNSKFDISINNTELMGVIDCIDGKNIYEFKCTEKLDTIHKLQLALYMYLNNNDSFNYYLYNILTDELIKISSSNENLKKMFEYLKLKKTEKKILKTDEEFIEEAICQLEYQY